MIRPANAGSHAPGRGLAVVEARNGVKVAAINLMGQLFIDTPISPWEMVDDLVEQARAQAPVVVVDFHAEATSEKVAIATWLDGRVTAVIGTHTHVQTNDARILPHGTAAVTDAGMTGPARLGHRRRGRARDPADADAAAGALRSPRTAASASRASSSTAPTRAAPRRSSCVADSRASRLERRRTATRGSPAPRSGPGRGRTLPGRARRWRRRGRTTGCTCRASTSARARSPRGARR